MGRRNVRKFSVGATLRPDFRASFKSTDCLHIKALTFEPLFQTTPLLLGDQMTPPPTFCPPLLGGCSVCTQCGRIDDLRILPQFPVPCPGM